jgi:hypothetical protein
MTGSATFLPTGHRDLARPVSTFDAARWVDRPAGAVARDVMNRDPDRVAGSDTLWRSPAR